MYTTSFSYRIASYYGENTILFFFFRPNFPICFQGEREEKKDRKTRREKSLFPLATTRTVKCKNIKLCVYMCLWRWWEWDWKSPAHYKSKRWDSHFHLNKTFNLDAESSISQSSTYFPPLSHFKHSSSPYNSPSFSKLTSHLVSS